MKFQSNFAIKSGLQGMKSFNIHNPNIPLLCVTLEKPRSGNTDVTKGQIPGLVLCSLSIITSAQIFEKKTHENLSLAGEK